MHFSGSENEPFLAGGSQRRVAKWKSIAFLVLISTPMICVIILFALYGDLANSITDDDTADCNHAVQLAVDNAISTSLNFGSAVSLTNDGKLRAGGGTSIYTKVLELTAECPKFYDIDAVFDSSYLVSFFDANAGSSSLQVVQMSAVNQGDISFTTSYTGQIYEIVTLSQKDGTFVAIEQDSSADTNTANVFVGKVAPDGKSISLGTPVRYSSDVFSMNPAISRLSNTAFAISYFETAENVPIVSTRAGSVDVQSLTITLSNSQSYSNNENFTIVHEVVGLSSSQYVLSYYSSGMMTNRTVDPSGFVHAGGPLLTQLVQFNDADVTISLDGAPVEYINSSPAYYLAGAQIDENSAVLVFADRSIHYGILAVLISVDPVFKVLQFGSSLSINTGQALETGSSAAMDLDVVSIPPSEFDTCGSLQTPCTKSSFAVLYSDATNSGFMTLVKGKVTPALELVQASPEYVMSFLDVSSLSKNSYPWGAMAASSSSRVGILTSLADATCVSTASNQLSVMESFPRPFGIVKEMKSSGTKADVTVGGLAKIKSGLSVGKQYYTNTLGTVVSGNLFYGRECAVSEAVTYIDLQADQNLILSLDSSVGTALSDNTIQLSGRG